MLVVSRSFGIGLVLLLCTWGNPALAGSISISSQTRVVFEENQLQLSMEIVNRGDESAYDVQVTAEAVGKTFASEVQAELPVNEPFNPTLNTNLTLEKSGNYPVIIIVHYKDANRYPFSALTLTTFTHGSQSSSGLFPVLANSQLADEGVMKAKIKNTEDQPRTAQMRFILPKELSSPDLQKEISLEPHAEYETSLQIKNFSALSGSRYPAYILLEYESNDLHFSSLASGQVEIVKKKRFVEDYQPLLWGAGLLLLIALIVLNRGSSGKNKPR